MGPRRLLQKLARRDRRDWPQRGPVFLAENARFAGYQVGGWSYGSPTVPCWDHKTRLAVGKFCCFAGNVTILLGGEHRTNWVSTYPLNILFPEPSALTGHPSTKGDIVIGNDVWIGQGTTVLSGVKIRDGAVLGAGSVVTRDVPEYATAAGVPERVLRYRFDRPTIKALKRIQWWHWPLERIKQARPLPLSDNVREFVPLYGHATDE